MEKKEKSMWFLSTSHMFTAYFAIPIVATIAIYVVSWFLFTNFYEIIATLGFYLVSVVLVTIAMVYGVYLSRNQLEKKYVISNAKTLVNRATIYATVITVLLAIPSVFLETGEPMSTYTGTLAGDSVMFSVLSVVSLVIFYYVSKRAFKVG